MLKSIVIATVATTIAATSAMASAGNSKYSHNKTGSYGFTQGIKSVDNANNQGVKDFIKEYGSISVNITAGTSDYDDVFGRNRDLDSVKIGGKRLSLSKKSRENTHFGKEYADDRNTSAPKGRAALDVIVKAGAQAYAYGLVHGTCNRAEAKVSGKRTGFDIQIDGDRLFSGAADTVGTDLIDRQGSRLRYVEDIVNDVVVQSCEAGLKEYGKAAAKAATLVPHSTSCVISYNDYNKAKNSWNIVNRMVTVDLPSDKKAAKSAVEAFFKSEDRAYSKVLKVNYGKNFDKFYAKQTTLTCTAK